jgi:hypothetical protein
MVGIWIVESVFRLQVAMPNASCLSTPAKVSCGQQAWPFRCAILMRSQSRIGPLPFKPRVCRPGNGPRTSAHVPRATGPWHPSFRLAVARHCDSACPCQLDLVPGNKRSPVTPAPRMQNKTYDPDSSPFPPPTVSPHMVPARKNAAADLHIGPAPWHWGPPGGPILIGRIDCCRATTTLEKGEDDRARKSKRGAIRRARV